jgi:predicted dehydrogenase
MRAERLNLGVFRHDVDVTWDLAPHDISIMAFLLGTTVRKVKAVAYSHIAFGKTDVATIHLEFSSGATAEIALSWLDPHKVRRITVIGDEKMAVFDDMSETEKLRFYDKSAVLEAPEEDFSGFQVAYRYGDVTIPNVSWSEPLREEWADFAAAISESGDPRSGLELGLEVVSVLEACQASMRADSVWMCKDGLADDMVRVRPLGQGTRPLAFGTEVSDMVRRPPL